jgi:hypothetical protein
MAACHARCRDQTAPPPRWRHPARRVDDPVLQAAFARAEALAEAKGWERSTLRGVLDGLLEVLAGRPSGEQVPLSCLCFEPHQKISRAQVIEVLTGLDLLVVDTSPAIQVWIDRSIGQFPPGFSEPVGR